MRNHLVINNKGFDRFNFNGFRRAGSSGVLLFCELMAPNPQQAVCRQQSKVRQMVLNLVSPGYRTAGADGRLRLRRVGIQAVALKPDQYWPPVDFTSLPSGIATLPFAIPEGI